MDSAEDEDGEDPPAIDDLFPFLVGEAEPLKDPGAAVRKKLGSMSPDLLRRAACFLFALDRLPHSTPGLSLDLSITDRGECGMSYVSVELSSDSFRLSRGGSVYTEGAGSDSYSESEFELELGGFREGRSEDFYEWLSAFDAASGDVTIDEIDLDPGIDLTRETDSDGWDRLAAYWDREGEGDFGY